MKKLVALLVLLMLVFAAIAYFVSDHGREAEQHFSLAPVEYGTLTDTVSATGVIQPQEVIPVGTEASGKVIEVAADFNQIVSEGDLLVRLDDRAAEQKLRQAEVAVQLARAEVDRAKALREGAAKSVERLRDLPENVSARKELDVAEAQLKAANAAVDVAEAHVREGEEARSLAQLAVQLTQVRVPVLARSPGEPGRGVGTLAPDNATTRSRRKFIVLDRKVDLNQQVVPGASAPLFLLGGDLSQMQVYAQVAEGDIGRVHPGQQAEFTVSTYDDTSFSGRVSDLRLLPTNDRGAIYYRVVIDAANSQDRGNGNWQLRPGMTASVEIVIRRHESVWKVPQSALNFHMPDEFISEAARAKLDRWEARSDHDLWKPLWSVGSGGKPWPIFARFGGADAHGDSGIRDVLSVELLEWESEMSNPPDPKSPETYPQLIIGTPPTSQHVLFNLPKIKI
jgi:HlyD family secretion protein